MLYFWAAIIGLASGVCSGLFGVGGGIIMVPAMVFLLGMDMKRAVGTSLAIIIPTAIVGSVRHFKNGNLDITLILATAPWALASGYLGAWLTQHVSSMQLKRAFGVFLILVGTYIVFGDRQKTPPSSGKVGVSGQIPRQPTDDSKTT
jgi:uncharacterized membrane protein YfcA